MLKAAVFDMDGLMFDTETLVYRIWQRMMDEEGYPYSLEDFKQTVGKRKAEVQNFYFGKYGEDFPYWDFSAKCRQRYLWYIGENGVPVKKGLLELLDFLKEKGFLIALATSTSRVTTELNLESAKLTEYFDTLVCGEDVVNGKPHPEVFLDAAARLGVKPSECVALEDSVNGIKSAYAAGMTTVMVPDMIRPSDQLLPMIDLCCDSLGKAIPFIEGAGKEGKTKPAEADGTE